MVNRIDLNRASEGKGSLRLQIRTGKLARNRSQDPAGDLDQREPEELFSPIETAQETDPETQNQ